VSRAAKLCDDTPQEAQADADANRLGTQDRPTIARLLRNERPTIAQQVTVWSRVDAVNTMPIARDLG
jgi:hypothetical protein